MRRALNAVAVVAMAIVSIQPALAGKKKKEDIKAHPHFLEDLRGWFQHRSFLFQPESLAGNLPQL